MTAKLGRGVVPLRTIPLRVVRGSLDWSLVTLFKLSKGSPDWNPVTLHDLSSLRQALHFLFPGEMGLSAAALFNPWLNGWSPNTGAESYTAVSNTRYLRTRVPWKSTRRDLIDPLVVAQGSTELEPNDPLQ